VDGFEQAGAEMLPFLRTLALFEPVVGHGILLPWNADVIASHSHLGKFRQPQNLPPWFAPFRTFYGQHDRWPTNEAEFGWFVAGEKPPTQALIAAENRFRARYGLGKRKLESETTEPPWDHLHVS
jgi:hypothetical protein